MFGTFRKWSVRVLGSLEALGTALTGIHHTLDSIRTDLPELLRAATPENLEARVDDLERARALWEAEVEGLLMKAEGERRNARSAEERARQHAKRTDSEGGDADSMEEIAQNYRDLLHSGDDEHGEGEEVPTLHASVGAGRRNQKAFATRAKFGVA